MRFSEWAIVILMLFLTPMIAVGIEQDRQDAAIQWRTTYDRMIDRACEDAAAALLLPTGGLQADFMEAGGGLGSGDGIGGGTESGADVAEEELSAAEAAGFQAPLNLNAALNRYRLTLRLGFGLDGEPGIASDTVDGLSPVQLVVGESCLFVHSEILVRDEASGHTRIIQTWQPGIPYAWYDAANRLVVGFSLSGISSVYDEQTGEWFEGTREEIATRWPAGIWRSEAAFENQRSLVVTDLVRETLATQIHSHGGGKAEAGSKLVFNIPYATGDSWYNAIDGISFIGYLQGTNIPGTRENYTTAGFGGGRLAKSDGVAATGGTDGRFYHRIGCLLAASPEGVYPNEREAAAAGYWPCPDCRP